MTPRKRGLIFPSRRAAFARGLRMPHIGVPASALLLAAAVVALGVAVVARGDYAAVPETRLLRLAGDDATHIAYQVAALRQRPPADLPVYILGGSAMREATVSDASVAGALSQRSGVTTETYTLAGNEQSFAHDRAIVDNLPPAGRRGAVVVIGVGFERFMRSSLVAPGTAAIDGLLIPGAASESFHVTGSAEVDDSLSLARGLTRYASTYAREHVDDLFALRLPSTAFVQHRYAPDDAWTAAKKRAALDRWYEKSGRPGGAFDRVFPSSAADLERLVASARRRGFSVVLVEQPYDFQVADGRLDRLRTRAAVVCADLAVRYDATYVDFLPAARLGSDDFHDVSHLLPSGRPKFQSNLVAALTPVVCAVDGYLSRHHASLPPALQEEAAPSAPRLR